MLARRFVFLALQQRENQLVAGRQVLRRQRHGPMQQNFRVVFDSRVGGHFREQTQGFDVLAMDGEILTDQVLRQNPIAVEKLSTGELDLAGEGRELCHLGGGLLRLCGAARCGEQSLQRPPAFDQAGIELGGARKG